MDWRTVFAGLSSAAAVSRVIAALVRRRRGTERALLLELQKNINLVYLWRNDGAAVDKVIARLETRQYEAALQGGFDFNSLKRKRLAREAVAGAPSLAPYVGRSTEQLFENIHLKIHALKSLAELDARRSAARLDVRLRNLLRLMLLLVKHIRRH